MIKQAGKYLGLLGLIGLAIIWIAYIWEKLPIEQGIDYSLKTIISVGILFVIACAIEWMSPQKKS